jgi:hypothetical protein
MAAMSGLGTDFEKVQAIVDEVGDTPDGLVSSYSLATRDKYAGKALLDPQLQVLYTTRDLLKLKRRQYAEQVDFTAQGDVQLKLSQRTAYLTDRIKESQTEIERLEMLARRRRGGVTTPITTVVPVSVADEVARENLPPPQLPDPSDPSLGGWPFGSTPGDMRP